MKFVYILQFHGDVHEKYHLFHIWDRKKLWRYLRDFPYFLNVGETQKSYLDSYYIDMYSIRVFL
jgi:hypothetical protein